MEADNGAFGFPSNSEIASEKEQKLYDFIKISTKPVTVKVIEEKLGKEYIGALGKLLGAKKIQKKKKRQENLTQNTNLKYQSLPKQVKYYVILDKDITEEDIVEDVRKAIVEVRKQEEK